MSRLRRAVSISRDVRNSRNVTASKMIMAGPPTNSAAVNCQPIRMAQMMPGSITSLAEAIWNSMAAVKHPLFRNSERADATAA